VVAGDFNGDGILDLATVNSVSNSASILLGNGDGTFYLEMLQFAVLYPQALAVADFNGDGKVDLAVAGGESIDVAGATGTVSILLNIKP
jgi:hypothetical protein